MATHLYSFVVVALGVLILQTSAQPSKQCTEKADIVFILDSSASEGSTNFHKQLDFVKRFVQQFNVGPDKTQFSAITFSSSVKNNFWLNDHQTQSSVLSALNNVAYSSGITNTDKALDFARQNSFLSSNGGRSDAEKIVIVLTDGQSTSPSKTSVAANALHHSGVEVITVGIGNGITQSELAVIASDRQHVFQVQSFDALQTIQTELTNAACQAPSAACGKKKADIVFVLDSSSSIGSTDFTKQLEFVKNNVRQFDIGPSDTQISVVSFSDSVFDEFHLNRFPSKTQVLGAISAIKYHTGTTYTNLALAHVRNESFSAVNGGRPDAAKVVIVLTDGQSTSGQATINEANKLHMTGAEVTAIGIGSGVDKAELNVIATDSAHVFEVQNYDVLSSIQHSLEVATCQTNECRGQKADIVFLLDSSASEGSENFNKQLEFMKNFTAQFQIGHDNVQMGLAVFSTLTNNEFWLNTYNDSTSLENAIDNVQYLPGNTYTDEALQFIVNNSFTSANGMRDGVPHILVVMTDGQSHDPAATASTAKLVHDAGIKTVAIGIGSDVDKSELQAIATDADHMILVPDFNALATIQSEVEASACKSEKPDQECGTQPADIVFILDASGSEGHTNFNKQLQFMGDFVKQFQIGPQNVQVGLVTFSTSAHNEFYFNTYHDQAGILNKLNNVHYSGGTTHTDAGLQYSRLFHFTSTYHGARRNAQKIAIVMTDGQSSSKSSTSRQAQYLRDMGVKVISIGIGSGIDQRELNTIATDSNHAFSVSSFDVLKSIEIELKNAACGAPTQAPNIDPKCGKNAADIIFLLDSSGSETRTNFNKQLDFVKNFASQFQIGPGNVQVGVATFSTHVDEQIKLNAFHDQQALMNAISHVSYDGGLTYTDDALKYARQTGFLPSHGGRTNATHIVVVMTDGQSYSSGLTKTQATLLKNIPGMKVISIGIGSSVNRNELLEIASDSSHMFEVANFNSLSQIGSEITFATCNTCGYDDRADMVFAIDASGSEGSVNFQKSLDFMAQFVNSFPVGPGHVQFGLVTFGTHASTEFDLNQYGDKQSVLSAIQKANYDSGTTATGEALKIIREHSLQSSAGARPGSHHFVIVLTDGASTDSSQTVAEASKLKQLGNTTVISIGIGSNVDKSELNTIATDNHHVFNAIDFNALSNIRNEVRKATCDALSAKPTTTPVPTTTSTTTTTTTTTPTTTTPTTTTSTTSTTSTTTPTTTTTTMPVTTPTTTPKPTTTPTTLKPTTPIPPTTTMPPTTTTPTPTTTTTPEPPTTDGEIYVTDPPSTTLG
ncbi:collagen alpha-6(VI) chain-like isoform X1 [Pecten maximus]|uniref:collagen alpha-6(VI) chain-like isoform X1 n=1 Tax=Pecten maximus TaxID=6579 RepID=UPI00145913C4|nr:collagen alpha-6(VI) chain-like isoform X1 [Pecten maximus]XP_033736271.1 collagen alpha-6(VI) chain-like isoform X1 [Pecten maximus]